MNCSSWLPEWWCYVSVFWAFFTADCGDNAVTAAAMRAIPAERWERLYDDTRKFVKLHGRLAQVSIRKRGLPDFVADLKPEGMSLFGTPMLHMSGCMDNKVVLLIDAVARDDGNPTVSMIPGELQAPEILWTSPRH